MTKQEELKTLEASLMQLQTEAQELQQSYQTLVQEIAEETEANQTETAEAACGKYFLSKLTNENPYVCVFKVDKNEETYSLEYYLVGKTENTLEMARTNESNVDVRTLNMFLNPPDAETSEITEEVFEQKKALIIDILEEKNSGFEDLFVEEKDVS
jgi:hypothetical protein